MEVDTGAAVSLVLEETDISSCVHASEITAASYATVLRTHLGKQLSICGCMNVDVFMVINNY